MTDTIKAPKPNHADSCRHSDCAGECCVREECSNQSSEEQAKQPAKTYEGHHQHDCACEWCKAGRPSDGMTERMCERYLSRCVDQIERTDFEWRIANQAKLIGERTKERDEARAEVEHLRAVRDRLQMHHERAEEFLAKAKEERDEYKASRDSHEAALADVQRELDRFRNARADTEAHYETRLKDLDRALDHAHVEQVDREKGEDAVTSACAEIDRLTARNAAPRESGRKVKPEDVDRLVRENESLRADVASLSRRLQQWATGDLSCVYVVRYAEDTIHSIWYSRAAAEEQRGKLTGCLWEVEQWSMNDPEAEGQNVRYLDEKAASE